MKEPAYITVNYGNGQTKKYYLNKDEIFAGTDPGCDIVLDQSYMAKKLLVIMKRGEYYVAKALTDKGIFIKGEKFFEKILEPGDYTSVGNLRADYFPPDVTGHDEEKKIDVKIAKKLVIFAVSAIIAVFVLGNLYVDLKEKRLKYRIESELAIKPGKTAVKERAKLTDQELIQLLVEVRKRDIIAEKFINESDVNPYGYVRAVNEWLTALRKLKNTDAPPEITVEITEKTAELKVKIKKIVKYLSNNAFVAHQQDNENGVKYILQNIIAIIDNPADSDYIWAKKKYIGLVAAKKGEKKK